MSTESRPATGGAAVTPSDSADITETRGLYIGTAGNLKVTFADGTTATLTSVANGVIPLKVKRVWATGTTATGITALY